MTVADAFGLDSALIVFTLSSALCDSVMTMDAFSGSLQTVWQVMTGIVCVGLLASLLMQDIPLQNAVDEKWALGKSSEVETNI